MAARAIWKGVLRVDDVRVPVKLYSAIVDRSVHFRLLHRKDKTPVRQVMINPDTDDVVPRAQTHRGYITGEGDVVLLNDDDREALEPVASRDINVIQFLPSNAIGHRWYMRPYYLGADGRNDDYFALSAALHDTGKVGLARWVMRNKAYLGALGLHDGYPTLSVLHSDEEVSPPIAIGGGPNLKTKELSMAGQLIRSLEASFEPHKYHDEHRRRVLDMIETKRHQGEVKTAPRRRKRTSEDIESALEASLEKERKRA